MELFVIADGLARGLHLRGQVGVHAAQLGEGKSRDLDIIAGFLGRIAHDKSLAFQCDAQADKCGDVCQAVTGCFGEERHSPGGARVDLDDVDILPFIDDELDIEETADSDAEAQPFRVVEDRLFDACREAVRGIDADRVARVDAGPLDQLHDARDKDPLAVAHSVYFHFFAAYIVVHEDRPALIDGLGCLEIAPQVRLFGDDLHSSAAQDETGADEYRITDLFRGGEPFFGGSDGASPGLRDPQRFEEFLEQVPVLRLVDGIAVSANNSDAAGVKRVRQIDRRLSSERHDDAIGLFHLDHVHYVFHTQGFKIQLIRACVVRGNGLRIIIDDDCFVTRLLDRLYGVDGGVVKLYALSDADRAGSQYDHLFLVREVNLVFDLDLWGHLFIAFDLWGSLFIAFDLWGHLFSCGFISRVKIGNVTVKL